MRMRNIDNGKILKLLKDSIYKDGEVIEEIK